MGISTKSSVSELGGILISAQPIDSTGHANASATTNGLIYLIDIDNTKNDVDVYLKVVDSGSAVGGNNTPDWMFKGKAGVVSSYVFNTGLAYSAGIGIWCSTSSTVGTNVDPTNSVRVDMVVS